MESVDDSRLTDDLMIVTAARALTQSQRTGRCVCFVGIGLPSLAANLARRMAPPGPVLIYESGCLGAKPARMPVSIGDGELATTADAVVSVPEVFDYWLQGGRIDVGFLGAAQIDRRGNLNSTVIGSYERPTVRLPGAGGAPEIATSAKSVMVIIRQSLRTFVEKCDFVSSAGRPSEDARAGGGGAGVRCVITDLGVLEPVGGELVMTQLHPGCSEEEAHERTGWDLQVSRDLRRTELPTSEELAALAELRSGG